MQETGKQVKCPNCGGVMEFDPASQKMKCPYCDTQVEVQKTGEKKESEGKTQKEAQQEGKFRVVTCKNCGAELLTDEFTTATFCSYCGSPSLVESRLVGEKTPDYVIPFQYNKNQAVEAYRKWTQKGFLTPAVFKKAATMEKISGIYVPFWLYDYDSDLHAAGECVRIRHTSDSENDYTHRDYYYVCRDIEAHFKKIPADASEKMDDDMMDKLEPFDYKSLKPFQMEFLSGYLSERYNMDAGAMTDRIESRVNQYMEEFLSSETIGYSEKHLLKQVHHEKAGVHYALLPVWILNYRYKNKNYSFAMNGQTGKIVADLPVSKGKAAGLFGVCFVVFYLLICLIGGLIG